MIAIIILSMLLGASFMFMYLSAFVKYEAGKGWIVKRRTHLLRFKNLEARKRNGGHSTITYSFDENDPICNTVAYKKFLEAGKELNKQVKYLYL